MILSFFSAYAGAANFSALSNLNFGSIIASPYGDQILIDASSGPASPVVSSGGISTVSGGSSGRFALTPDQPGQTVNIDYPPIILLSKGTDNMSVTSISVNSTPGFVTTGTSPVDINVGGMLTINNGQAQGTYSGSMTVNVEIINP